MFPRTAFRRRHFPHCPAHLLRGREAAGALLRQRCRCRAPHPYVSLWADHPVLGVSPDSKLSQPLSRHRVIHVHVEESLLTRPSGMARKLRAPALQTVHYSLVRRARCVLCLSVRTQRGTVCSNRLLHRTVGSQPRRRIHGCSHHNSEVFSVSQCGGGRAASMRGK